MKNIKFSILLFAAVFAFAQEDSTQPTLESSEETSSEENVASDTETTENTALVETATLETPAEESPAASEVLPERTPEGYRIIRIERAETKVYKDSVKQVERQIEEDKKPTIPFRFTASLMATIGCKMLSGDDPHRYYDRSNDKEIDPVTLFHGFPFEVGLLATIPLTEATIALKVGALYEYTYLKADEKVFLKTSESSDNPWREAQEREPEKEHITQMRVSFPLLLALKGRSTPAMFEIGSKISIPIQDEYKSVNLVDYDLRPTVDVAFLVGGTAIVNKYFSITGHIEIQPPDFYDDELFVGVPNIMLVAYRVGVLFTPF